MSATLKIDESTGVMTRYSPDEVTQLRAEAERIGIPPQRLGVVQGTIVRRFLKKAKDVINHAPPGK